VLVSCLNHLPVSWEQVSRLERLDVHMRLQSMRVREIETNLFCPISRAKYQIRTARRFLQSRFRSNPIQDIVSQVVDLRCCLCGKEGFRREFVAATLIFLMQAGGLKRFSLARFEDSEGFLPDAVFRRAGRQRRHVPQARHDDEPEQQDYFFSRVQAAGRLPG